MATKKVPGINEFVGYDAEETYGGILDQIKHGFKILSAPNNDGFPPQLNEMFKYGYNEQVYTTMVNAAKNGRHRPGYNKNGFED